ncbi:MAG: GNAT family N-acetyltransferase [Candidatus Saccharibacteria bacterium]
MTQKGIVIRHADGNDLDWLTDIMTLAFAPFCSANQRIHASDILSNQLVGSSRRIGTFVTHQHVLVAVVDGHNAGVIQIFEEKHSIIKIGLLIVAEFYRGKGVTTALLGHVEHYAAENKIRQLYCNVPSPSVDELGWLYKKGFRLTGISKDSPAKGINEYLLYKQLIVNTDADEQSVVKVVPFAMDKHGSQAMTLIFNEMSGTFDSVNPYWVNNLLNGKLHDDSTDDEDVNHIIFVSMVDGRVTGLVGATLPKSGPIMLIPLVAEDIVSFEALLIFAQDSLIVYSHKLYVHLSPSVDQIICLQRHGWVVEGLLAGVYSPTSIVQQWAFQAKQPVTRTMRIGCAYYDAIVAGTKTIEVRLARSEYKHYKVDELIQFEVTSKPPVLVRIKAIRLYNDLQSAVNYEVWSKIIPEVNTRVEALRELRKMMPDSEGAGFYVFEFEVVKP